MQKDFIQLWLVIAKPLTVMVCVNIRIKFNLPYPYSFFFLLFVYSLGCFPAVYGNLALQSCPEQPEVEYWSPTGWVMAHAAFLESFSLFLGAPPPHWQFCCLCLLLCSCLGFFSSGIMVIKDKWVKSYLGWEKRWQQRKKRLRYTSFLCSHLSKKKLPYVSCFFAAYYVCKCDIY